MPFSLDKLKKIIDNGICEIIVDKYPESQVFTDLMENEIQDIINSNKFITEIPIVKLIKKIPALHIRFYKNVTITISDLIEMKEFYDSLDSENKNYFCKNLKEIVDSKIVYEADLPF